MASGFGPTKDTAVGELVSITLTANDPHSLKLKADRDGCGGVIVGFDRLPDGKFSVIQRNGGVHPGDCIYSINDALVDNTSHKDVLSLLSDRNVLRKQIKFLSSVEYYGKKNKHVNSGTARSDNKSSMVSKVKRCKIVEDSGPTHTQYEISLQWKLPCGGDRVENTRIIQWSVWKRYNEFKTLHAELVKTLGWQVDKVEFPPAYHLSMSKFSPEFIERRREELNKWWQSVMSIDKVAEFDKHHSNPALRAFLDVDQALAQNPDTSTAADDETASLAPSAAGGGIQRRGSGNFTAATAQMRRTSRKFTAKQLSQANVFSEVDAASAPVTSAPAARLGSSTSPASSVSTPAPASPTAPTSSVAMSSVMKENLSKYQKMKDMLPEGAVRQRMAADGCNDVEIDGFFGVAQSAPVVSPSKPSAAPVAAKSAAPANAPPKTAARTNLLSDINKRRID